MLYAGVSGLQALFWGLLTLRRLYRKYPVFYAYTLFEVLRGLLLYWITYLVTTRALTFDAYFYAYWITDTIATALGFAIVYRVFDEVFKPYDLVRNIGRSAFALGVVATLIAAIIAAAAAPDNERQRIVAATMLLGRSVGIVRCGLLLLLLSITSYLRLAWRSQLLGIAVGMGLWSATDLITMAVRTYAGPSANMLTIWMPAIGYTSAVIAWFGYFSLRETNTQLAVVLPEGVEQWNEAVTEFLTQ